MEYYCGKLFARSQIAGLWGVNVKLYQIVFWSGCTTLYFGQQFCQSLYTLISSVYKSYSWSISTPALIRFLNICQSNGYEMMCLCDFNLHFFVNEFEHLFMFMNCFPFVKCLVISFTHFSLGLSFETNKLVTPILCWLYAL